MRDRMSAAPGATIPALRNIVIALLRGTGAPQQAGSLNSHLSLSISRNC